MGDTAFGYPVASLRDVPAGDYTVQSVFVPYRTYHRADGHTVSLPPDRGEGQRWDRKPGDLYSAPRRLHLDPSADRTVRLSLDSVIPEISPPEDTPWVKHVRIQSALLTNFWGAPTYIQATVLLPAGFAQHPNAHYPVLVEQGHFGRGIPGWRPEPEDASLPAPDSTWLYAHCWMGNEAGCREHGIERMRQRLMHGFYQWWTSPNAPRVLLLTIQHANPYYDDSYAVNSANLGPYGDAITKELIPEVEKRYRGIGAGWARVLTGGSTGGWEALGVQLFYPDDYNGAWGFCPDPVDFHFHQAVDVYDDANAYLRSGPLGSVAVPGARGYQGRVRYQMADENHMELALGTRGRSGGQWDIWQAVFGPVGADGYPKPIWNKRTGAIDRDVAGVLAGPLRPHPHPPARLEDPGPEAARQAPRVRGHHGLVLPERRRPPHAAGHRQPQEPARRLHLRLWRARPPLLDRGPRPPELGGEHHRISALPARHGAAHGEHRPGRGGHAQLEVLSVRVEIPIPLASSEEDC